MFKILKKIFGTAQSRRLKNYSEIVNKINLIEKDLQDLTEEELVAKTAQFKRRLSEGETLENLLPEAYAVVKNMCRRLCGTEVHVFGYNQRWDMVPYDVQILGAIAMHYGTIAEMQTGEGKTLTAAMPLYLNALTGKTVHLVTVNDYLAKRDCEWMGTIFKKLGLTIGYLTNDVPLHMRKETYGVDILYGTASEFGFDYLRDNSIATDKAEQCQRPFYFAIIDEIDSILIDEARTPLIISGPSPVSRQMYGELKEGVAYLVREQKEFCNLLAYEAKKTFDSLGSLKEEEIIKLTKEEGKKENEALKKLWLVSKGMPRQKILKRVKEHPDLRAKIENWETYYFSEQNKEERSKSLAELYIIVDERANEYELTDKGISIWSNFYGKEGGDDFVMLDLGEEYLKIDSDSNLSEEEKIERKIKVREEDATRKERAHNLQQLFRAYLLMEKDVDYIVQDNKIVIIDENTGRPQPGRRFSDGLHQAIEAKEGVTIQRETQTFATITLQNFFRMYEKISGMTGTAITEANEFKEIYKLEVLQIPTYLPCIRKDSFDEIYMTEREKYRALLEEIKGENSRKRPLLIGTESVEISEKLSRILKQNDLSHTVLNAKNHLKEAEIIAGAGKKGAITIATNMAGRGTDIKLEPDVIKSGGLHVIGTTRHHSRRIDRQLIGRGGRLGDPGSSKFFVSFEDSLMRLFASPKLTSMLQRFRPPEGEAISAKVLNKSIETAQKRIEQRNYMIRKHTLEYDDVMNKQRQEIYSFRNEILHSENNVRIAKEVIENICSSFAETFFIDKSSEERWNPEGYRNGLMEHFPITFERDLFSDDYLDLQDIEAIAIKRVIAVFEKKIEHQLNLISEAEQEIEKAQKILNSVIKNIMIGKIDELWQEHLLTIDHLRGDVSLRAIGQKDPLIEFKEEAFNLFYLLSKKLKLSIAEDLFKFEMLPPQRKSLVDSLKDMQLDTDRSLLPSFEEKSDTPTQQIITTQPKIGRNTLCPCGSGKKHKKCCGIN